VPSENASKGIGIKDAVAWAAANYENVVGENNGRVVMEWGKAAEPPPNDLARSYLKVAASNPNHFFGRMVPSLLGGEDAVSEEDVAQDKKQISQIRSIIRKYLDHGKKA
jgi:hypothetical protein